MTDTVLTTPGSSSYHRDPDCPALDTAQLFSGGKVSALTAGSEQRTPCVVCASPPATAWTVTAANLGQLWELIGPSKPHLGFDSWPQADGLTIWAEGSATGERTVARFGDTIRREPDGRYSIHPAAPTTA